MFSVALFPWKLDGEVIGLCPVHSETTLMQPKLLDTNYMLNQMQHFPGLAVCCCRTCFLGYEG